MEKYADNEKLRTAIEEISLSVRTILATVVTCEYAEAILTHYDEETELTVLEAIVEDVILSSNWDTTGEYNTDDIRLAIGRELAAQLGE